jgi:hypothetical protein
MMATDLYSDTVKGLEGKGLGNKVAIYNALHGVEDTWDCHFQIESYVLLDRLIMTLLLPNPQTAQLPLVDSNRVFLVGFSAGGDGAY